VIGLDCAAPQFVFDRCCRRSRDDSVTDTRTFSQ